VALARCLARPHAQLTTRHSPSPRTHPVATRAALLALKQALGLQVPEWAAGSDPCNSELSAGMTWPHVYCNQQGRVYVIDLSSKGLTGSLSDAVDISRLRFLQTLWLFDNPALTGARACCLPWGVWVHASRGDCGCARLAHAHPQLNG
jgi:hypothetical protein